MLDYKNLFYKINNIKAMEHRQEEIPLVKMMSFKEKDL
jgi:hypothetical protein